MENESGLPGYLTEHILAKGSESLASGVNVDLILESLRFVLIPGVCNSFGVGLVDEKGQLLSPKWYGESRESANCESTLIQNNFKEFSESDRERFLKIKAPFLATKVDQQPPGKNELASTVLRLFKEVNLQSLACIPIISRQRIIGFAFFLRHERGREFLISDSLFLENVTLMIAAAIENDH